jgi:hypothetical protein
MALTQGPALQFDWGLYSNEARSVWGWVKCYVCTNPLENFSRPEVVKPGHPFDDLRRSCGARPHRTVPDIMEQDRIKGNRELGTRNKPLKIS